MFQTLRSTSRALLVAAAALATGCGPVEDDTTGDDDVEDPGVPWEPMSEEGDAVGDCGAGDASCEADIVQLYYARDAGTLHLDLHWASAFPEDQGSFELFLIPVDTQRVGHTFQYNHGQWGYWNADCSSARDDRHDGCHWSTGSIPESFVTEWTADDRFRCQVAVADLGFEDLTTLLMGVGAAPFFIQQTAEFTDRYPDELWVYSTEIAGLHEVPFVEP